MKFHASTRRDGIFHVLAVVAVLATLMLAGRYGESINVRIDGKNLPTHASASPSLLADCVANSPAAMTVAIRCGGKSGMAPTGLGAEINS